MAARQPIDNDQCHGCSTDVIVYTRSQYVADETFGRVLLCKSCRRKASAKPRKVAKTPTVIAPKHHTCTCATPSDSENLGWCRVCFYEVA